MNAIEQLRQKMANGEITAGSKSAPVVGEGTFKCVIAGAEYGDNQNGTAKRGMVKYKVVGDMVDDDNTKVIGGLFNTYISTANQSYLESNIATYVQILLANGVTEDKIYDDAETLVDVVENVMQILSKMANRGKDVVVHIKRKEQDKKSPQGKSQYWNDILESTWTTDEAPTKTEEEAVTEEADEALEALNAPAEPATDKKPWE